MSSPKLDTRARILTETLRLMEKQRGQAVRLEDIARAVGVSRQAVYLHFATRADLLIAAVRYADEMHGVDERLQRTIKAGTGVAALDAYVEFWGNYIPEIYGLAKALIAMYDTDEAAAAAWDDRMCALRDGCHEVINCLVRDQALAQAWNPAEAADMMWTMLSIVHWEDLTKACGWSTDQYVRWMQVALKQVFVRSA